MDMIYELKTGDVFAICGYQESFNGAYRVEKVLENVAVCQSMEQDRQLMLPLFAAMPFAVLKGQLAHAAQEQKVVTILVPDGAKVMEQPVSEKEETAAEVKAANAEKPAAQFAPRPFVKGERKNGVIEHYDAIGHWGKISHDRFAKGIFFHMSQVEDEALREQLNALTPGAPVPELTVSYVEAPNPRRFRAICASEIRMEMNQDVPAVTAQPVVATGYITSYDGARGTIMVGDVEESVRFNADDIADERLSAYLNEEIAPGTVDSADVKVEFLRSGRKASRITWVNAPAPAAEDTAAQEAADEEKHD